MLRVPHEVREPQHQGRARSGQLPPSEQHRAASGDDEGQHEREHQEADVPLVEQADAHDAAEGQPQRTLPGAQQANHDEGRGAPLDRIDDAIHRVAPRPRESMGTEESVK